MTAGTNGAPRISLSALIWLFCEALSSVALFQAAMPRFMAEPMAMPNATL